MIFRFKKKSSNKAQNKYRNVKQSFILCEIASSNSRAA